MHTGAHPIMDMPRRLIVTALLKRGADLLAKEDDPWLKYNASIAADILVMSFRDGDESYDGEFALSGDHALNAVVDSACLSVTEYIFDALNLGKLAAKVAPVATKANEDALRLASARAS